MRRLAVLVLLAAAPVAASTPASYTALDKRSAAACLKAAGLKRARAGAAIRFSDAMLIDARTVTGSWPQPHTNGAAASLLCLYNRKTGAVEVQEAAAR